MTRQQLFAAFFFAVFFFLLYQFYCIFGVFLVPLTWAALLAFIFYPLHARLTVALRGRNSLAAFCFTTLVILVVMVPTVLLIILLANESVALYQSSSEVVASGQLQQLFEKLKASAPARASKTLIPMLESWNIDIAAVAMKAGNALSTFLVSQAAGIAKNVAAFVVDFFLTTFALFFFFRDGSRIVGGIRGMLPMEPEYKDLVLRRLYDTLSAVVQGTLAVAAAARRVSRVGVLGSGRALRDLSRLRRRISSRCCRWVPPPSGVGWPCTCCFRACSGARFCSPSGGRWSSGCSTT